MNRKGQVASIFFGLGLGVMVYFLALAFVNPMSDVITEVRSTDQLDCGNSSISDGKKFTCLFVDVALPSYIAVLLGLATMIITAKFVR